MFEHTDPFLQAELDYRRERIRSDILRRSHHASRPARVRRPWSSRDDIR